MKASYPIPRPSELPPEIIEITGRISSLERPGHGLQHEVYILAAECGRFVLKVSRTPENTRELHCEARVLDSLEEHQPLVPAALQQVFWEGQGLHLFSFVEGENMVDVLTHADVAERHLLVAEFGRTLRSIHSWTPQLPRPADWLSEIIARAESRIQSRPISDPPPLSEDLDDENPAGRVVALKRWRPQQQNDLVFSHGDYCLPNVLVTEGKITGIVDWSAGGYADRRFDLATALWTIGYNLGEGEYAHTFLEAYGYNAAPESLYPFEVLYFLL